MREIPVNQRRALRCLFKDYRGERVFIDGCLEGGQGFAWADDADRPQVAMLYYGFPYLGGDCRGRGAGEIIELAAQLSDAVVAPSDDWCETICNRLPHRFTLMAWTLLTSRSVSLDRIRDLGKRVPPGCRPAFGRASVPGGVTRFPHIRSIT